MIDIFKSYVHAPVPISSREQEVIDSTIMGCQMPWYYMSQQTFNKSIEYIPENLRPYMSFSNPPFLSHTLLARTEVENVSHLSRPLSDFSYYYEFFIEIFHRFTKINNIKYTNIFRANLNLTWYHGNEHTEPHLDHSWNHKNFIMYLNDCERSETIIWPNDFSTSYFIPCKKNTAVTFEAMYHAQRLPKMGERRVVFVVTYI